MSMSICAVMMSGLGHTSSAWSDFRPTADSHSTWPPQRIGRRSAFTKFGVFSDIVEQGVDSVLCGVGFDGAESRLDQMLHEGIDQERQKVKHR